MRDLSSLPTAVIGAGPVGLAAAAQLLARGVEPLVFERGSMAGASVSNWAHVRLFSPWEYNVDAAARRLLDASGWTMPDPDHLPTGGELISDYLAPLARHPEIASRLRFGAEVTDIAREGHSRLSGEGRDAAPFTVVWRDGQGIRHRTRARAVIDASGTSTNPNPIGTDGLPVDGETGNADRIDYGIPDVLGTARPAHAGARTLVIGAGHSAINTVLDLMLLQDAEPATRIVWATRSGGIGRLIGGGLADMLPDRGRLGLRAAEAIRSGRLTFHSPFAMDRIDRQGQALRVSGRRDGQEIGLEVDRIVVATGFRPDHSMLRELRLSADPVVETTPALAPLIDPNLHSCGTVRPHGVVELRQPESDFYIVGMKSYGRAPTFLMATGYEQMRSVAAELVGDHAAARDVRLKLPETGVCKTAALPAHPVCCAMDREDGFSR
ncbi:FAD-dependent oxidoreductase [Sedimentitalea sp. JM2-8]|uniref:FAD-dependent oxidoreductase n=1 Tax=Sedimentitalea xiamensis TaxID=3050037 RepID=A0ABT7FJ52_9RHOB|nr:FAD-dependent oxidoreductase [Sedimentitalea xiamensis]MDK3075103.1 FAD-dependent oxidoreductase [Sedimentitalea xiamensis]